MEPCLYGQIRSEIFENYPTKLWARILIDKYLRFNNFMNCKPSPNSSPIGRDILKSLPCLLQGLMLKISDGNFTSILIMRSLAPFPLTFPTLKLWNFTSILEWCWSFTSSCITRILSIRLPQFHCLRDSIRWAPSTGGIFSFKSAYYTSSPQPPLRVQLLNFNWKKIWKVLGPFKYWILLWNIILLYLKAPP